MQKDKLKQQDKDAVRDLECFKRRYKNDNARLASDTQNVGD
jgi:hypothetical protein